MTLGEPDAGLGFTSSTTLPLPSSTLTTLPALTVVVRIMDLSINTTVFVGHPYASYVSIISTGCTLSTIINEEEGVGELSPALLYCRIDGVCAITLSATPCQVVCRLQPFDTTDTPTLTSLSPTSAASFATKATTSRGGGAGNGSGSEGNG